MVNLKVTDLQFADSTYLIEVKDSAAKESFWPFVQFDDLGKVKDAFCSCERGDQGCKHLDLALSAIMGESGRPLHERFASSLWNHMFFLLGEKCGFSAAFQKKKGLYHFEDIFFIRPKSKQMQIKIAELIENRSRETPETSIKFSNLPQEEISRWREGRAGPGLRYELSYFADLAKLFMLMQEKKKPYQITIQENDTGLPLIWKIDWKEISLEIQLSTKDLITLIPYLESVRFPLPVHELGPHQIQSIQYDVKNRRFLISHQEKKLPKQEKGIPLDDWLYISGKGFFQKNAPMPLSQSIIPEEEIGLALEQHNAEIAKFLTNTRIHATRLRVHYTMSFDDKWNWHFSAYLLKPNDLSQKNSVFFGNWAYLDGKGFFPLRDNFFSASEAVILASQVSRFVHQNRIWLHTQKGFETHLASIESQLIYKMSEQGLFFQAERFEGLESHDFGDWIYFQNLGFFSKTHIRQGGSVRPGQFVPIYNIAAFIKANREELELIPGFFTERNPIIKRGLFIERYLQNALTITPTLQLLPELIDRKVQFLDEFVYVEGEGFSELSLSLRLPAGYEIEKIVSQQELPLFFAQEWPHVKRFVETIPPYLQLPMKWDLEVSYLARNPEGGLRAQFFYRTDKGKVSVTDLLEAIEKKKRYLFSDAGLIDLKEERFRWLKEMKAHFNPGDQTLNIPTMMLLRLDAVDGLFAPQEIGPAEEMTKRLLNEIRDFSVIETPDLKGLKSDLRPYQKTGLHWLWFLYKNGLSGLLCDEMGLGKTHQAMALIVSVLNSTKKKNARIFVVCPTSVIYHWQDKLAAFLPHVKVHTFHGQKRVLPKSGILLTSYGMLRSEKDTFLNTSFEMAIFDEIQIAKNPQSKIHQALAQVNSVMRVGLTGTPIENNLRELKALFDLVLPGYMPHEARYRELFILPIERDHDEEKKALLSQLIRPFILRRRKQEVLLELPEKSEEKAYCDLSQEQVSLYQSLLDRHRQQLIQELRDRDSKIPYIHIFSLLSTLKQICNHPALFYKDAKNYAKYHSGKWDLFVELLNESRESEQKVVIFSQYLDMLDIMRAYVQERGWGFAEIRGSTIDRKEQMRKFQEDKDCHIFLGSLQAAGLGIDLTAASCVLMYDRWWNAARENQAIDRVHRIGQKTGVQVYKLITKNTIEEKIDLMITKKSSLMEIISTDDQSTLKKFSRSELIELLTFQQNND